MRQQAQAQAQTTSAYTDSVPSARDAYRTPSAPASTCILLDLSQPLKAYQLIEV